MAKRLGWRGLLVGLVVGLAAGGTFAWASIPNSTNGVIKACYPTSGPNKGALRVIDYEGGERCAAGEASLRWGNSLCGGFPTQGVYWNGCDLQHANLNYQNLTGAILTGANFTQVKANSVLFNGANFTSANLSGAVVVGSSFTGTNVTGANFTSTLVTAHDGRPSTVLTGVVGLTDTQLQSVATDSFSIETNRDPATWVPVAAPAQAPVLCGVASGPDLSLVTFTSANLAGFNLSGVDLTDSNLTNANLTGANLSSAFLQRADLTNVDLTNANLHCAYFANVNLSSIIGFTNADLRAIYLPAQDARSSGLDMSGWDLTGLDLFGMNLASNVTSADFTGANLDGTVLAGSTGFTNADLRAAAHVAGIDLHSLNLTGWDFSSLNLNTDPTRPGYEAAAIFSNTDLTNANFTSADLTDASGMSTATLTGVTWTNARCPDETLAANHGNTCIGHL